MNCKSSFLNEATERGFIHQTSNLEELDKTLLETPQKAYIGFDCTADSLHVGSLVSIMLLRLFQKAGHKPIILMGGGTTKVGDPSGKDETRKLLDNEGIAKNIAGISSIFKKFIDFDDPATGAVIVNNADWLDKLEYIPFLRDVGRHFSVNRMLSFDSVKLRLERTQNLSFLEFNYMILQAYDFAELHKTQGCRIQMGGSDQWGNIINGVDLGRRLGAKEELFALTTPLITTANGAKMGKTASGAVWLNEERCGAYDYWQFWRNTDDADVAKFLRLFTDLSLAEIAKLEALDGAEINEAKKILATEATKLCHGAEAAQKAAETAAQVFETGQSAAADLPTITVSASDIEAGIPIADALCQAALCKSKGEARRMIKQNGVKLNDAPVSDEFAALTRTDFAENQTAKLSVGKKKHALVKQA
ncbi:MAG: tyrosine--tRNA ligase [Alphaproteobacteria bacterium]